MPTLSSSMGSPGIIHNRTPKKIGRAFVYYAMDDLTTERSFDSQATWVIDALGLFL